MNRNLTTRITFIGGDAHGKDLLILSFISEWAVPFFDITKFTQIPSPLSPVITFQHYRRRTLYLDGVATDYMIYSEMNPNEALKLAYEMKTGMGEKDLIALYTLVYRNLSGRLQPTWDSLSVAFEEIRRSDYCENIIYQIEREYNSPQGRVGVQCLFTQQEVFYKPNLAEELDFRLKQKALYELQRQQNIQLSLSTKKSADSEESNG